MNKPKTCKKCGQSYTARFCPKCKKKRRSSGSSYARGGARIVISAAGFDPRAHREASRPKQMRVAQPITTETLQAIFNGVPIRPEDLEALLRGYNTWVPAHPPPAGFFGTDDAESILRAAGLDEPQKMWRRANDLADRLNAFFA